MLKIYLEFKIISYPINIDYFLWWSWLSQVNYNWLRMNKTGWLLLINLIPTGLFRGSVTLGGGCYNPPSLLYFWITNAMLVELGTIINCYNTINLTLKNFSWRYHFFDDIIKLSKNHEFYWFHLYLYFVFQFWEISLVKVLFMSNTN